MLQPQDSWESGASIFAKKPVDSEPCRGINVLLVKGLMKMKAVSGSWCVPGGRFLLLLRICIVGMVLSVIGMRLQNQKVRQLKRVGKGPTGIVECPKTTLPVPFITTSSVKRKRNRI